MFELYKKRQLGDYIIDSFTFFRFFGKHFFKIFFIINTTMLLVAGALMYCFLQLNFKSLFENNLDKSNPTELLSYFDANPILGVFAVLFLIIIVLASLFNSAYPILYLKLIAEKNNNDFEAKEILSAFKQNIWKIFKFTIGLVFIVLPVLFALIVLLFFLCFVLVGFPLLIISIPTIFTWINVSLYTYLSEEKSFFQSLNHAYLLLKDNFWSTIGATFLVMIMLQMIQASITMFLYFIGIFVFIFAAIGDPYFDEAPFNGSPLFLLFITLIFVVILALSTIFNNILVVNQGVIYYSLKVENKVSTVEIESIGSNE